MLSKHYSIQRDQLEMITLDQLVPAIHMVHKIEAAIDFTFIYDLVKDMYSEVGRPSIDPVILVKLTFIQYTFGIRSMRKTIEHVFADAKEKHVMRWTTLRGLKKFSMQAMLTFAAINLKKMANWTWQGTKMA
ncbi:transposase [Peribacillus butanolivorans]|uniref:transposase n=1 Tax=Peribacillus butanolivorans TaxID=421767 RepID=UPI0036845A34